MKKLPISELKIDRAFIRDLPEDGDDTAITIAILALAKALSLDVIAEGVENEKQVAQNFLYSKPLDASEFVVFTEKLR